MPKYKPKTKMYEHQKEGVRRLVKQGFGGALLMEPRTGKSKTTIDYLSLMNQLGKIDRVVIVSPNRIMGTWIQEFHLHCPQIFHITVWDAKGRKSPLPEIGAGPYQLQVVIVNYEAFATPGKKTASGRESKRTGRWKVRGDLRKWLGNGETGCIVLDESHKIKSPSGRASNMMVSMSEDVKYRAILTGTPLTKAKRAHDVYMQWKFLNPSRFAEFENLAAFKAHFGRWQQVETKDGKVFPKYMGPKNVRELQDKMAHDAVIVRREDCFDLPPREDIIVPVKLRASRRHYEEMAMKMITILESGEVSEASIRLVQNLRLTQITSGFVTTDEGDIRRVGFEKSDQLKILLEDLFEKDQKVVVAARWKPDLNLIEDMGKMLGFKVWSIRGGVKRTESDKAIVDFKNTDEPSLMVIQPQAASMGIDLSTASTMIWYSHTSSWVDFSQACDRVALSKVATTFYHLIAQSSVDEMLMDTLLNDGDIAKALMTRPRELLTGHHINMDASGKVIRS